MLSLNLIAFISCTQIYVIEGRAPLVEINCVTCQAYKTLRYSPSRQMKLQAKCMNCGNLIAKFSWQILGMRNGSVIPMNNTTISSLKDSPVLIISENVLDGKQSYNISAFADLEGKNQ